MQSKYGTGTENIGGEPNVFFLLHLNVVYTAHSTCDCARLIHSYTENYAPRISIIIKIKVKKRVHNIWSLYEILFGSTAYYMNGFRECVCEYSAQVLPSLHVCGSCHIAPDAKIGDRLDTVNGMKNSPKIFHFEQ